MPKRSSFAQFGLRDRFLTLAMRDLKKHKNIADHEIEKRISVILQIYFILLLLAGVALLFKISEMGDGNFWKIGKPILSLLVIGSIYWGLIIKSKWVIPFILIVSAFGTLNCFLHILVPAENIGDFFVKFIGILFLFFFGYQLKFFTSRSVKNYFNVKGRVFF